MQHFCFRDLSKEKLCSILVFENVCFDIVVRINHDNVASRGAVGRTHTIVRLQTRIRRKDGTENFGGFVHVLDEFLQRHFFLWVFMCSINFSLFFWVSFPAATPRATTPHRSLFRLPRRGLQRPYRCIQANRLPRLQGYHTRATTLQTNFWVVTGRRMDCRVTTVEELLSSTSPNSS